MSEDWPVWGQNNSRTGHDPALTRPQWPVREQWRHDFAGKVAWNAPINRFEWESLRARENDAS